MKGEKLSLQVAHGTIDPNAKQLPAVKFQSIKCGAGDAFILLENPRGNKLGGSAEEIASKIYGKGMARKYFIYYSLEFTGYNFIGQGYRVVKRIES